jgi:hypothetical protein
VRWLLLLGCVVGLACLCADAPTPPAAPAPVAVAATEPDMRAQAAAAQPVAFRGHKWGPASVPKVSVGKVSESERADFMRRARQTMSASFFAYGLHIPDDGGVPADMDNLIWARLAADRPQDEASLRQWATLVGNAYQTQTGYHPDVVVIAWPAAASREPVKVVVDWPG